MAGEEVGEGAEVEEGVFAGVAFEVAVAAGEGVEHARVGEVFEVFQVVAVEAEFAEAVEHVFEAEAGAGAVVVGDFAPLEQLGGGGGVDLGGGEAGDGLDEVAAVAAAEVAPLVGIACGEAVGGFAENLNEGVTWDGHGASKSAAGVLQAGARGWRGARQLTFKFKGRKGGGGGAVVGA